MQDVGHVYGKMCPEQDWDEFEELQSERREKQVRVYPGLGVTNQGEVEGTYHVAGLGTRVLQDVSGARLGGFKRLQVQRKKRRTNGL